MSVEIFMINEMLLVFKLKSNTMFENENCLKKCTWKEYVFSASTKIVVSVRLL